jgi:heat-inducible transcriptional repressor
LKLSERKKKIITAVVEEHIRTAEPVSSKAIQKAADLDCSSATIRNELSELGKMGYLEQPHTSAGRVPTPLGYRTYVNELMVRQKLSIEETERLNRDLDEKLNVLEPMVSDIGQFASSVVNYPILTLEAQPPCTISRFDLIYLSAHSFIIVLLLSNSQVKTKLVKLPVSVGQEMITKLSSVFNANFTDIDESEITPLKISSMERAVGDTMGILSVVASYAIEVLSEEKHMKACVSGANKLLSQPEYQDPEKARELISFLSENACGDLLPQQQMAPGENIKVLIGPENVAKELKDSSVILASYDAGQNMKGLIGVVGPTRMDYSGITAKLRLIASELSRRLGGPASLPSGLDNKLILKGDIDGQKT